MGTLSAEISCRNYTARHAHACTWKAGGPMARTDRFQELSLLQGQTLDPFPRVTKILPFVASICACTEMSYCLGPSRVSYEASPLRLAGRDSTHRRSPQPTPETLCPLRPIVLPACNRVHGAA